MIQLATLDEALVDLPMARAHVIAAWEDVADELLRGADAIEPKYKDRVPTSQTDENSRWKPK